MAKAVLFRIGLFFHRQYIHDGAETWAVSFRSDDHRKPCRIGETLVPVRVLDPECAWGHLCPRIGWNRTSLL
jgi:hypothetical protein